MEIISILLIYSHESAAVSLDLCFSASPRLRRVEVFIRLWLNMLLLYLRAWCFALQAFLQQRKISSSSSSSLILCSPLGFPPLSPSPSICMHADGESLWFPCILNRAVISLLRWIIDFPSLCFRERERWRNREGWKHKENRRKRNVQYVNMIHFHY